MGANIDYKIVKHGFYPDVMGWVTTKIQSIAPGKSLDPIDLTRRGPQKDICVDLYITATAGDANHFYEKTFKKEILKLLKEQIKDLYNKIKITIHDNDRKILLPLKGMKKKGGSFSTQTFSCDAIVSYKDVPTALACDFLVGKDQKGNFFT